MKEQNNQGGTRSEQDNGLEPKETQREQEMRNEQKGGQGSKGGSDQHGAHGKQSVNPNGKLPSGQDGYGQDNRDGSGGGNG